MRLLFFYSITFILCCSTVFGQDTINQGSKIYKLDLIRAAQGTIQFTYEHRIATNYSMNIGLLGTYASTRGLAKPYLSAQEFTYTDGLSNKVYILDNVDVLGYGFNFQLRKYLNKKNNNQLRGFYIAPEIFYRRLQLTSLVENNSKEVKRVLNLGYVGYVLGYQKIVRDIVSLDSYIGGGFFISQYTDEKHVTRYRNNYQIDYTGMFVNMGVLVGIVR